MLTTRETGWSRRGQTFLYLIIQIKVMSDLNFIGAAIVIPNNSNDKDRPWRVWSGDPCQPCDIDNIFHNVNNPQTNFTSPIRGCENPCFYPGVIESVGVQGCLKAANGFDFTCNCEDGYGGKFCEKSIVKRDELLGFTTTETSSNPGVPGVNTSIISVGNETDYLVQCQYQNGSKVHYDLHYMRAFFPRLVDIDGQGGLFRCDQNGFISTFKQRCSSFTDEGSCKKCKPAAIESLSRIFTHSTVDQFSFRGYVRDVYNGSRCEDLVESRFDDSTEPTSESPIRDNASCARRNPEEETYRAGCRLPTSSIDSCIENKHLGHRCITCDEGVWGNKCQFVNEKEWKGCTDRVYNGDGPCGQGGTLVERPNGKFCVCPPGKIDGFVNVFEDRVKDPNCSPAGKETDGRNDKVHFADSTSKYYKFFVEMSQFHTYYGCRIDDPCQNFTCLNKGAKQLEGLIDEDSFGWKWVDFLESRLSALEINKKLKCKCNCDHGYEGDTCEFQDPCVLDQLDKCQHLGQCHRLDNENKRCDCPKPYEGPRCEITNLCETQRLCGGSIAECFPCKHGGKCNSTGILSPTIPSSYQFTCNCSTIGFVGELCEYARGNIDIRILTGDPLSVLVGSEETYEISVQKLGDNPRVIVDMGDGFHFSITKDSLVTGANLRRTQNLIIDDDSNEKFFHEFKHKYTTESQYHVRAFITNGDPNPNERADQINPIYLSSTSFVNITVLRPPSLECLPGVRLINVARTVDESTPYTRVSQFTVEAVLEPKCDEFAAFDYKWFLNKLDSSSVPVPNSDNNWHIEKVVNVSQKYVTFKSHNLLNGPYVIEYEVFAELNGITESNSAKGYFNIELNPPKIVIHGGLDRNVDVTQETILDASDSLDESFPERSRDLLFEWSCESCNFKQRWDGTGPWKGPVLKIPPGSLFTGEEYNFHLDVSLHHKDMQRSSMAPVRLVGSSGSLFIECIESCSRMNPGDEILLVCSCSSCSTPPEVEFSWEPMLDDVIPVVKQNKSFASFRLPSRLFGDNTTIGTAVCKTTQTGLMAKLDVRINTPPSDGDCDIQPLSGVYLTTAFNISCEGFTDDNYPLQYSFYAFTDAGKAIELNSSYLLAHDTNPRATNVYLPYNPNGEETFVLVKVTDSKELSAIKQINVQISQPDDSEYPTLLKKLIIGSDSLMARRKMFGDEQGALQLQLVVLHGLLDGPFPGLDQGDLEELGQALSSILADVPLNSFKAVEQSLESLYLLNQVSVTDSMESLAVASTVFFNGVSRLAEFVLNDNEVTPTETLNTLARAATDSGKRILKRSYQKGNEAISLQPKQPTNERRLTDFDSDDDIHRDYFFEVHELEGFENDGDREGLNSMIAEYAKISQRAYGGLEHLLDAVGERLDDGHKFSVMGDGLTVYVDNERTIEALGLPLELESSSGNPISLKLSSDVQEVLESQGISNIILEVTEVLENPFFDDSSAIPGTSVISVVIKDKTYGRERLPIHLEGLKQPFELIVPLTPTSKDILEKSKSERLVLLKPLQEMSEADLHPYHLVLPYNTRVDITIDDYALDMQFSVVALKDFWPTKQDFCDGRINKILNKTNGYTTHFNTEVLGLNDEPKERFLEYYISVFPFQAGVFNEERKYSIQHTRASCLFRDENSNFWSEQGCRIGNDSTASSLHCICNHASIFAGTQFTVPNDLPKISISNFSFKQFQRNPVVLITVCTLIGLYGIGIIICSILDRRDQRRHVGITIMADLGDNLKYSYYLVTVLTGSRFGAGTTASVSIQMYGTNGRSQVYVLKEKAYPVLNRGGTDTFLLSSENSLGDLEKIRIWHDNYGSSPNWFCRKVIVQDAKSSKEWYFFIDRWLEISGTESTIILERSAATEEEHSSFRRRLRENLTDQLDNSHLWLSLFRRPAASRFNRCQRLSCAFAILTSYLMLTIIWYGIELEDIDDPLGLQKYVFAIQLTVMALPFGLILVFLFRRIRHRYLPTLIIWRNFKRKSALTDPASVFIPEKPKANVHRQAHGKQIFGIAKPIDRYSAGDNGDFRDDVSGVSSNFSIPSTNIEDLESWLGFQEDSKSPQRAGTGTHYTRAIREEQSSETNQIAIGRTGLVHAVRAVNPASFIFQGESDIPEMEHLIDNQIKTHLVSESLKKHTNTINDTELPSQNHSTMEFDEANELGELLHSMLNHDAHGKSKPSNGRLDEDSKDLEGLSFETCEMSPVIRAWCFLPWWFIMISWIVCLSAIFICLFITLLYGLEYGYLRSIDWLRGVSVSFITSLFVIQPLNVFISGLGLTLCLRSKKSSEIREERFQILVKEKDDLGFRKPAKFRVFHHERKHPPPSGNDILRLKVEARGREKIRNGLLRLIFYGFILLPLIILAYAGHSSNNFLIVNNIRNLFKLSGPEFSDLFIRNEKDLYEYLEQVLIPAVHPEVLYNGIRRRQQRFDAVYVDDGQSIMLGVPRIRQIRVRLDQCDVEKSIKDCYRPFSKFTEDRETYNPYWIPVVNSTRSQLPSTNDVWKYNGDDAGFTRSLPKNGEMALYDGGGFVAELGRRFRESFSVIRFLKRSDWIDHRTRAVLLELTMVNPNVNIFTDIVLMIERTPSQEFLTTFYITPLVLNSAEDLEETPWIFFSYAMLVFSAILLTVLFVWKVLKLPHQEVYLKAWFWLDLMTIGGIVSSLLIALKAQFVVEYSLEQIEATKINEYVNLQLVAYWNQLSTAAFSISQCVCFMKVWRVLISIDDRFLITSLTIKVTARFMISYFLALLIIIIAFASGGHFIFGKEIEEFHTFSDSMISLIDQVLSVKFFSQLATTHRVLGPIYSFLFGFFLVFIALNLLISLLNQGLHEAKQISSERIRRWTYGTYFSTTINYIFNWNIFSTAQVERINGRSLLPDRLEKMKKCTAIFFRDSLVSSHAQVLRQMKMRANETLQGTGYKVVSRLSRKHQEDTAKETVMDEMRLAAGDFLRSKMGTEMSPEEMADYANFNRIILGRSISKLERKLAVLTETLEGILKA